MIKRLQFFIYSIVLFLAKNKKVKRTKRVLIIKTDEIGDYVLWRNFAPYFEQSPRFEEYALVLCGNRIWKGIATQFDSDEFDQYIWLDKKKFKTDMRYRHRFLKEISKQGYEIVINTIYSRSPRLDDSIVKAASAPLNIGMVADDINIEPFEKGYDKGLYQELIDLGTENGFDFYRNKAFTEKVTGITIKDQPLSIDKSRLTRPAELREDYFIIFPGSNNPARIWNTDNFVKTARFIQNTYGYLPVVCGGPADTPYIEAFLKSYPQPCTWFKEKEGLKDFIRALSFAKCIISVDTGSVHLAAAVQCPVYGIFNGGLYGRFAPYPPEVFSEFHAIYPDSATKYKYLSPVDYNEVTAEQVIGVITNSLKKI